MTKVLQVEEAEPVPHSLLGDSILVTCVILLFLVCSAAAYADNDSPKAGEQLKWQVISGGGTTVGSSTNFVLSGTAGQTAVGKGTSTNFGANQGFWQSFAGASCDDCGDANSDGIIDISDAVFLIAYIFSGGAAPGVCVFPNGMGDANGDGIVDISDAVYLIAYIFSGGSTPHC